MKLPQSLEKERDKLARQAYNDTSISGREQHLLSEGITKGFDSGALAVLEKAETILLSALREIKTNAIAKEEALADWQKFVGKE